MLDMEVLKPLLNPNDKKIVLLVMDGVGGLANESGKTELESSLHPNLDKLAKEGVVGLSTPVAPGITPGSGPAHLSLFGYDPIRYDIGRGVLEALGIGITMTPKDLATRVNFATMDPKTGNITDRRAGRIPTERTQKLCEKLQKSIAKIEDVEIIIKPGMEHRFVLLLRGEGLSEKVTETDPQATGVPVLPVKATAPEGEKTARILAEFVKRALNILVDEHPANSFLMRGASVSPKLSNMKELFGLKTAAIATYPMYRGLAKLVGMDVLETGDKIEDEFKTLAANWAKYDFFYIHIKKTDSYGEDGNYDGRKHIIEEVDGHVPEILQLKPAVVVVTGDHCTPSKLKGHSWHPCPVLLWAPETCLPDEVTVFGERACMKGGLGHINHLDLMPLMLAHALRLHKYGA